MSIIRAAREKRHGFNPYKYKADESDKSHKEQPKILDLNILKDYVDKVLTFMKPEEKPAYKRNRKHTHLWEVPIHHLLGKVNEPTWVYMIETQAKWAIDSWQAIQPNGRWSVYDFELEIERRDHRTRKTVGQNRDGSAETLDIVEQFDYLVVAIQIVDVKGESDLMYDGGRPTNQKKGMESKYSAVSNEHEKQLEKQAKELEDQKQHIFKLQTDLHKQNELMAALLTELQQQKDASKPKRTRK